MSIQPLSESGRGDLPILAIIIPVLNGGTTLRPCLEAILRAPGPSREVIVVDDRSEDDSAAIAAEFGVRTVALPSNRGCAAARNQGAAETSGPILVFIDCDVVIHGDSLQRIHDFLLAHPEHAAVFGSYDSSPAAPDLVSQYRNLLHHFTHQRGKASAKTFWTGLGAVRREAFASVGGFCLTCGGMEDVDFGLRLSDSGSLIALDANLLGTHLKKWTLLTMVRTDVFRRAMPWGRMILKRGYFTDDLNVSRINRLATLATTLFAGFLPISFWWPFVLPATLLACLISIACNAGVLRFFVQCRGLKFALCVLPLHMIYQLSGASGFLFAIAQHVFRRFSFAPADFRAIGSKGS